MKSTVAVVVLVVVVVVQEEVIVNDSVTIIAIGRAPPLEPYLKSRRCLYLKNISLYY